MVKKIGKAKPLKHNDLGVVKKMGKTKSSLLKKNMDGIQHFTKSQNMKEQLFPISVEIKQKQNKTNKKIQKNTVKEETFESESDQEMAEIECDGETSTSGDEENDIDSKNGEENYESVEYKDIVKKEIVIESNNKKSNNCNENNTINVNKGKILSEYKLMVDNLPMDTTFPDVLKLFSDSGAIGKIIISNPQTFEFGLKKTDSLRAIIIFKNSDSIQKALQYNETEFKGRQILLTTKNLKPYHKKIVKEIGFPPNVSIFIRNVNEGTNEEHIRKFFSNCGEVKKVQIKKNGQAYVRFATTDSVQPALKLSNTILNESKVMIFRYKNINYTPKLKNDSSINSSPIENFIKEMENNVMLKLKKEIENNVMLKLKNMKIERLKKSHKILSYYMLNFNYREPFQILIDGTFCQTALQSKVNIDEQLRKYLHSEIKLLTTQCAILESESLGAPLTGATQILKQYFVHKCGHEGHPIGASACILSMVKKSKYIISTQDRNLQEKIRKIPGQALIYLHRTTPVLEKVSNATKKAINLKLNRTMLSEQTEKKINDFKKENGIKNKNKFDNYKFKTKKKSKNPNPLSCKKKKKKLQNK